MLKEINIYWWASRTKETKASIRHCWNNSA